jgi:hypothetical protein
MRHPSLLRALHAVRVAVDPVCVYDLDATLIDNRHRTLEILRRYRERYGDLPHVDLHHIRPALVDTLAGLGVGTEIFVDASSFWSNNFFGGEFLRFDGATPGAVHHVRECVREGARIVYLSGREETVMRQTADSLRGLGFPEGDAMLRPRGMSDVAFKRSALERMRGVTLFIDNEPSICNAARSALRHALVYRIDTECLPGAPALVDGVELLPSFLDTGGMRPSQ